MSDNDQGAEKSFEPTQQRLDEARRRGEFPKSTDLHTAASYLGILIVLFQFAGGALSAFSNMGSYLLDQATFASDALLFGSNSTFHKELLIGFSTSVAVIFGVPALLVIASLSGQRAVVFSTSKIQPKLSKISPLSNAKQKFGITGLVEFAKSFVKLGVIGAVLAWFLLTNDDVLIASARLTPNQVILLMGDLLLQFLVVVFLIAVFIGAIDYLWQNFDHLRKNRMTRQEVIDETKQSEGDPHMKAQRKQKAQEIALNQMISAVEDATVVIVNPTHYAVALKWSPLDPTPPLCVAKGVDEIAARIREAAATHGVPIRSDPPTARALFATVDVGLPIDREHFEAVAAAIRFADEMKKKARSSQW